MGIWERFQSRIKEQVFFFLCVAIPVIFFMWKNPNSVGSQCCLPLSGHGEVSYTTYFRC